jgi:hypothetical protein
MSEYQYPTMDDVREDRARQRKALQAAVDALQAIADNGTSEASKLRAHAYGALAAIAIIATRDNTPAQGDSK